MNYIIPCIFLLYLLVINIIGYAIMGADKRKAKLQMWRIPEATLFLVALLGGSFGCIKGMKHFRHKTKHWYFVWGMPAILVVQIILLLLLIYLYYTFILH